MQRERKAVSLMLGPAGGGGGRGGTAAILQGVLWHTAAILQGVQWRTAGSSDE